MSISTITSCCAALVAALLGFKADTLDSSNPRRFREKVEPLFVSYCLECHGAERKGGLDLRSRQTFLAGGEHGPVVVAGDPQASRLFEKVSEGEMPPKHPLNAADLETLRQWIADGAYFPDKPLDPFAITTEVRAGYDWWSLQPVTNVDAPEVADAPEAWREHPIDRLIYRKLTEQGLEPSAPASPQRLIRRATYGLVGLPPTPHEVDAFLDACEAETGSRDIVGDEAYGTLIDRLLASPRYGEHWGRHWLDVVRFGESTGYEVNHIIDNLWPYRDYVIESFNADKPFDRFAKEQLAADSLDYGNPEVEVGMAFLVAGPHDIVGNQDPAQAAQIRANTIDEMIRASSEAFLGLTVSCARCHDHKFDPISQRDYYRVYATFGGVYPDDRIVATADRVAAREAKVQPLREERAKIEAEKNSLIETILARAETKAEAYEAAWTRPRIERAMTVETFTPISARHLRLVSEGQDINPAWREDFRIDEFEVWSAGADPRNVAAAANGGKAEGASTRPGDFGDAYRPDLAIDGMFGAKWIARGPELTITFAKPESVERVVFSSDRPNALGDYREAVFLCEYRIEISEDGENWTKVADSYDRAPVNDAHRRKRLLDSETTEEEQAQIAELNRAIGDMDRQLREIPELPRMRVGRLEQPKDAFRIFKGGDPQRAADEVRPASMDALVRAMDGYALDHDAAEASRRLAFSEWIIDPANPLTGRVLANRIWHYHFGTGIVDTPSDFGFMGGRPTHPELLDWLTRELVTPVDKTDAWRIKRMHRLIMTSQTYRQDSAYRVDAAMHDGRSRYLWRYPPRRLSAEEMRDSMLQAAGKLNFDMGGPGFRLYRYLRDNVSTYVPLDAFGEETHRRSIYHQNVRAARIDLFTEYDAPDCALPAPRRTATTSPLQALTLMNHDFTFDMAGHLAERLADGDAGIDDAFKIVLGRKPRAEELTAAKTLVASHGLRALCRGLFNANEFVYLD